MNPKSANALSWTAAILMILGLSLASPSGTFAALLLAAICVAIPSIFASRRPRIISIVLLVAAIALAANSYPAFKQDQDSYTKMVKERAVKSAADSAKKQ